jgi:hypothetical protein
VRWAAQSGEEFRHEPETNKTPACAVRGAVQLPARIPLSHHFFHDPVPSSLLLLSLSARALSLSVSARAGQHSAGARETGEKEKEKP